MTSLPSVPPERADGVFAVGEAGRLGFGDGVAVGVGRTQFAEHVGAVASVWTVTSTRLPRSSTPVSVTSTPAIPNSPASKTPSLLVSL